MAAQTTTNKIVKETLFLDKVFEVEKIRAGRKYHITTVGFYLALCVLSYLSVVTFIIFVDYFAHLPHRPNPSNMTTDTLANYQALSKLSMQRMIDLFELIIAKTMVPVLTAILGYIFGVKESNKGSTMSDDE